MLVGTSVSRRNSKVAEERLSVTQEEVRVRESFNDWMDSLKQQLREQVILIIKEIRTKTSPQATFCN